MSYIYQGLEKALEIAAWRLPTIIFGQLLIQAEDMIDNKNDSSTLERKIHNMVNEYVTGNPLFTLKKLQADNDTAVAAAAAA
jgi:hypothetical protein